MKCNRCKNALKLTENVNRKVELLDEDSLEMLCDQCKICYICYTQTEAEMECCISCGYFYHTEHKQEQENQGTPNDKTEADKVCLKCMELQKAIVFETLLGSEIPALERYTEDIDQDFYKKITEIVKKNRPGKNPEGITRIFLGNVEMTPLFSSPYPEEYIKYSSLYLCPKCMDYFPTQYMIERHRTKCMCEYPPGRLLYLDQDGVAVFEIEGEKQPKYCQSLCLLAKMFLDHKTLYYDVEPFLFYIIGEIKKDEFIMQGYFSKERGEGRNNLSCIVVFPPYRRLGLGSFLIDFSYSLTRKTTTPPYTAGPEHPLSADGERAYSTYWANCILRYIYHKRNFSPKEKCFENISLLTGVAKESIQWVYKELCKKFDRELEYSDFISNRGIAKKIRRLKKYASVQSSVESIKTAEEL